MFEFAGGGLSVTPDQNNTVFSFEIFNVGDEAGTAEIGCEIDNTYILGHQVTLEPNVGDRPYVDLGAVAPGNHNGLIYVNPGSGQNDHLSADFTVY